MTPPGVPQTRQGTHSGTGLRDLRALRASLEIPIPVYLWLGPFGAPGDVQYLTPWIYGPQEPLQMTYLGPLKMTHFWTPKIDPFSDPKMVQKWGPPDPQIGQFWT